MPTFYKKQIKHITSILVHTIFLSTLFLIGTILVLIFTIFYAANKMVKATQAVTATKISAVRKNTATFQVPENPEISVQTISSTPTPTPSLHRVTLSITPTSTKIVYAQVTMIPSPAPKTIPTINASAQAQQVLVVLNAYRLDHGSPILTWNNTLGNYAQSRADLYARNGSTDDHAGFRQLISTQNGFKQMGFWGLGENASYGFPFNANDLIRKEYASDKPHDDNQLDPTWTDVGIGVNGEASDIVFGKNKM